jgi:2-polyprenyl-3-methyl-5-hydroxy-6-metoxy-1,4-benzoquinol methylase
MKVLAKGPAPSATRSEKPRRGDTSRLTRARYDSLRDGTYARDQLFCRDPVIAWSHTSRFRMARRLVTPFQGRTLLDYGCGDGTFLALVEDLFPTAVGAELDPGQIARCSERLGSVSGLTFRLIDEVGRTPAGGRFDVVTCMEVLEHCVNESRERLLRDIRRLIRPDGVVIISVPIEIGPTLLIKETLRTIAGWRRLCDGYRFKERYRLGELLKMSLAGRTTRIERPVYSGPHNYHGHKGFNWRLLEERLARDYAIERRDFSPLRWSRGLLSSQVWFVCRPLA